MRKNKTTKNFNCTKKLFTKHLEYPTMFFHIFSLFYTLFTLYATFLLISSRVLLLTRMAVFACLFFHVTCPLVMNSYVR